ncbi:MAG: hypothetical protein ABEJ34_06715 [Haloferacaceae archaeon]
MDLEEGMVRKITVSTAVVVAFLVLVVLIGLTYGSDLGDAGGLALIGSIVLFILAMAGVGVYLAD